MKTIKDLTYEILEENPELWYNLSSEYVNISAIARDIKPELEKKKLSTVNLITIIQSLNRLKKRRKEIEKIFKKQPNITIKNNLTEIVISTSKSKYEIIKKKSIVFTKGEKEATLIIPTERKSEVLKVLDKSSIRTIIDNLNMISIYLPKETINMVGVYYKILGFFYVKGIPIIEIVSSYTEFSIVVREKYLIESIKLVKKIIKSA